MPDKAPVCPWCDTPKDGVSINGIRILENCGNQYGPKQKANFCPLCGRPLTEEAAMKRFEPMQKPCDDCAGIVYRQTASGKIVPDGQCAVKFPPPCYRPDGDGCAYQIYGDYDDEPIDKCKECPLCYTDKVRHGRNGPERG